MVAQELQIRDAPAEYWRMSDASVAKEPARADTPVSHYADEGSYFTGGKPSPEQRMFLRRMLAENGDIVAWRSC